MSDRDYGCVANFPREKPEYTVWRHGDFFSIKRLGSEEALRMQYEHGFQEMAAEMYRLAAEVGRLRRLEIERDREARRALAE